MGCDAITDSMERPHKSRREDKTIADVVVGGKIPSEAWKIPKNSVDDDDSEKAREQAKKHFKEFNMNNAQSTKEYITRTKSLAINVQYYGTEVPDHEFCRRVLNDLPSTYAPERRSVALRTDYSLGDLEDGFIRVEGLNRGLNGTDGSHALAGGFKARIGGQSGLSEERGSRNGGDCSRPGSDGKGRSPSYQPQKHQHCKPRHQRQQPAQWQQDYQQYQPRQQHYWQYQPRYQRQQPAQHSKIGSITHSFQV